jgi:hypothetical protein
LLLIKDKLVVLRRLTSGVVLTVVELIAGIVGLLLDDLTQDSAKRRRTLTALCQRPPTLASVQALEVAVVVFAAVDTILTVCSVVG